MMHHIVIFAWKSCEIDSNSLKGLALRFQQHVKFLITAPSNGMASFLSYDIADEMQMFK